MTGSKAGLAEARFALSSQHCIFDEFIAVTSGLKAVLILWVATLIVVLARKLWFELRAKRRYAEHMAWATDLQQFLISKNKELASVLADTESDVEIRRQRAEAVIAEMEHRDSRNDPGTKALIADNRAYVSEVLGPPRAV